MKVFLTALMVLLAGCASTQSEFETVPRQEFAHLIIQNQSHLDATVYVVRYGTSIRFKIARVGAFNTEMVVIRESHLDAGALAVEVRMFADGTVLRPEGVQVNQNDEVHLDIAPHLPATMMYVR
jgi:hypothetical protein